MTFSIGLIFNTGHKRYILYPLNIILLPLLMLFRLDAPLYDIQETDEIT